jgi:hypothetical protein
MHSTTGRGIDCQYLDSDVLANKESASTRSAISVPQECGLIRTEFSVGTRYKVSGTKEPVITVKADEVLTLRVTAKKAKNSNREGFIHGFTLLRSKDRKPVAPQEPGEYVVICTVICSEDHEGMTLKLVVFLEGEQG